MAISFTSETDGRLPSGDTLTEAIDRTHAGNPLELAAQYRAIRSLLAGVTVVGGCCGTDHRQVEPIACACHPQEQAAA